LVPYRMVSVAPAPLAKFIEELPDLCLACLHAQGPMSSACLSPVQGEPKEVEGPAS
jgi:hypothetical protein